MSITVQVGTATADVTPPVGYDLGGYGDRSGPSRGQFAALRCHVVVFDDGVRPAGIATCDLLFATHDLTRLTREAVAASLGWAPDQVMVTATHTHSGPAALTLAQDAGYVEQVARKIAGAIQEAYAARTAATLTYAEASVESISQNRRDPAGPIEPLARILTARSAADGTVSTIVNYACHATVLEGDNLEMSPDFPGTTVDVVAQSAGGRALYLQGCAGNINPVWTRHDHAEASRIGTILGLAAARAVHEAAPLGHGQWVRNLSWSEDAPAEPRGCRLVAAGPLATASVPVSLPRRTRLPVEEVDAALVRAREELRDAPSRSRELTPAVAALQMETLYTRYTYPYAVKATDPAEQAADTESTEVQVLRIGPDTAIVGIPGEPFIEIADEIRRRSGLRDVLVAGYANEAVGYLPVSSQFSLGGYEVGCARFAPEAADLLVDGALAALRATERVETERGETAAQ
jgi:hypothetical protein